MHIAWLPGIIMCSFYHKGWEIESQLRVMDEAGVSKSVLSILHRCPFKIRSISEVVRMFNDSKQNNRKIPDRFIGAAYFRLIISLT